MLKYAIIFFIISVWVYSKQVTNLEIISDFNVKYVEQISKFLKLNNVDKISINTKESDFLSLLKNSLVEKLISSSIVLSENYSTKLQLLQINVGVEYQNYSETSDSLNRIITYQVKGNFTNGDISLVVPEANFTFKDTISRYDLEIIENKQLDFAHGAIPNPNKNFFERVVEPIAIIATAALTVFLLFTLRTN